MPPLTRREFVAKTALAAAAAQLASSLRAAAEAAPAPMPAALTPGVAPLRWLEGGVPAVRPGTTWGVPWPQGTQAKGATFALTAAAGAAIPVQSWPLAYWPDGSLKWTGHAVPAGAAAVENFNLTAGAPAAPATPVRVSETPDAIEVDTGVIRVRLPRRGDRLIESIVRDGRELARDGRLVCLREDRGTPEAVRTEPFAGELTQVSVESAGPVRVVVKCTGLHVAAGGGRRLLPFIVRFYFYAGGDAVRVLHTIVYDAAPAQDFIKGLGLRFSVPLRGEFHDRHVRFSGQADGLFGEAVRSLTGLRRDPGQAVRAAQVAGEAVPPTATWKPGVADRLQYVPAFADWTLFQANADGFEIRKRTQPGYTWLTSAQGQRAGGLGYVGTPQGGVAFGIRNFWQSHPAQLDIRGATGDAAEVTAWVWAPDAAAMDLRPYHDGMGQDTYAKQYNGGLEITYEDYEKGYDSPEGVARTSELFLRAVAATPAREELAAFAATLRTPPVVMTTPEYLHACGVFGGTWRPVDRSTPAKEQIEAKLEWNFDYYHGQQEQRRWYGYWNYGDVRHTYDVDRHEWRYDVGGFAWDNSELSTDLWLWLYFLRTGRADVFRFAEAMTRHTGEVDVHHIGRFAPLGSRHNVLHWGCSAKQLRISTALNRRYYYYLTGDERVGDLLREQVEAVRALKQYPPGRKLFAAAEKGDLAREAPSDPNLVGVGFGTDWSAVAGAWFTEWERTGDAKVRDRLVASMRGIGSQPRGFFTASAPMHLDTGAFEIVPNDKIAVSHLSAVFGLVEICAELIAALDVPEFRRAWLDYCELYNAPKEVQLARLGQALRGTNLRQGHSRLTAYAARIKGDPALAKRAWTEQQLAEWGPRRDKPSARRVSGPAVLRPVDEDPFVSTNDTAQWGLAAIECLAWVGDEM